MHGRNLATRGNSAMKQLPSIEITKIVDRVSEKEVIDLALARMLVAV